MSKKWFRILLPLCFLSTPLLAQTYNFTAGEKQEAPVVVEPPLKSLTVGEKLIFDVFWMGIPVGVGTLEVKEMTVVGGRRAYHVVATARTNDFLSKLYPVQDEIHSYIDVEGFYSLCFSKTLKEGRYRADEKIVFDHQKKKGFYESFLNGERKEVAIPAGVHDLVSAFYWFRLQDIRGKGSLRTLVNSEEKNWDLELMILRLERKELRGNKVLSAILVEPKTRLKGILYKRGRAWVYFTADKRRLPITITLKTPFGPVVGVLTRPRSESR